MIRIKPNSITKWVLLIIALYITSTQAQALQQEESNTQEAISYGGIGMVLSFIEKTAKNKKLYFTGGDGKYLSKFFDSIYIKDLVFRGMKQTIKENNL